MPPYMYAPVPGFCLLLGDMPHSGISPIVFVRIFIYYCRNFVTRLSQKINLQLFSNFLSIFGLIWNREPPLFILITQPWRYLGAILWIHVIIHIFITIHSKSAIFNAHKLQVICQHTGLSISISISISALCARTARGKSQNSKFLHDLDSSYHSWQFPFICIHSWPFIRPCKRVKV